MYVAWIYKAGAQTIADDIHLSFVCVKAEQCVLMNPNRPIADTIKGHKTCRGPIVPDCSEMSLDGTDPCLNCQMFYKVCVDANCIFQHYEADGVFCGIIDLIVIGVMTFIGDLASRPNNNEDGETDKYDDECN